MHFWQFEPVSRLMSITRLSARILPSLVPVGPVCMLLHVGGSSLGGCFNPLVYFYHANNECLQQSAGEMSGELGAPEVITKLAEILHSRHDMLPWVRVMINISRVRYVVQISTKVDKHICEM